MMKFSDLLSWMLLKISFVALGYLPFIFLEYELSVAFNILRYNDRGYVTWLLIWRDNCWRRIMIHDSCSTRQSHRTPCLT